MAAPPAPKVAATKRRNGLRVRKNPSDRLSEALEFYQDFHWGEAPNKIERKRFPKPPKVAVKLGRLHSVTYHTSKGGEDALWEHEFGEEGGTAPDLVMDPKNKRLHIVGGTYDVQAAGIID